jgi:hypothetical protein
MDLRYSVISQSDVVLLAMTNKSIFSESVNDVGYLFCFGILPVTDGYPP